MTDPLERVYIQWGYSNFLPAIATCNHITSSGKQSLKFHTDVAMMGKLGYDIQIDHMNEQELKFSQDAIKTYRHLSPTIWFGDLYRLVSPYGEDRAVVMYVKEDQSAAVLFSYTLNARFGESFTNVRLQGLSENKNYKITEVNLFPGTGSTCPENGKTYSGRYLMKVGLQASSTHALTSSVFEITQE
jgi:alpha-galactosidase